MPAQASASARPGTSSSVAGRPTTAGAFIPYDPTFDEDFDEDEDSDDEDVFAFLPPTTAEQQEQQAQTEAAAAGSGIGAGVGVGVGGQGYQEIGITGYGMQYGHGQASSPYAMNGAGTAAAAAAALQAQYYSQQQQHPHAHAASSPFSHSPFAHGAPENPSSSTLDLAPSTQESYAPSTSDGFNPWARPSTAHLVSNVAGPSTNNNHPYGSGSGAADRDEAAHSHFASIHSYTSSTHAPPITTSIPTNDTNTTPNPYAAYTRPSTSHLPPRSPPSPSTDSHPSTAAGTGMANTSNRGDVFKLRRLTSTNSIPPAVTVEGGRRVVQSEDDEDEEDDLRGVGAKEVRVSLPGTTQRQSRSRSQSRQETLAEQVPDSPSAKISDDEGLDDGASETAASEKGGTFVVVDSPPGTPRSKNRRKRAGKHRSKSSGASGAYAGDVGSAESGTVAVSAFEYAGVVASGVQIRSGGAEGQRRMRNLNTQPYYAYAALANAHGYDYGSKGTSRPNTRNTSTAQTQQRTGTGYSTNAPEMPGLSRQNSTSGSFVAAGKRRGKEFEDDGIEYDDGDSMSMSGMSGVSASVRDGESREGSIKMEFDFDAIEDEDSPFPEVRASVSNIDDPDMPAMTIRMWFVGLILCMTSSALNVFFNFRSPAPTIVPLALLLVSYPFGKLLAFILPITTYRIPLPNLPRRWFPANQPTFAPSRLFVNLFLPLTYPRALEFSLNPGPWNIKEHVLVFIMANVATGSPYALNAIVVSDSFYNMDLGYWFALTLVLATQLTGFGLAGLCRRFLVWPASMVWPQNLVACTLLNTLHAEDDDDGIGMYGGTYEPGSKGMSRYRFFVITSAASFVFFFLPGYLFEALSIFSFVCWAAPNNVPVNQLFGVRSGLGMSVLTFDWTQIAWIGSPLMVPWWAEMHVFIGFVLFFWIMTPILYYTNSWDLAYFPISANEPYDRFGQTYNVTRILTRNDTFDQAAYFDYSPLYLPATYAVTYLLAFALSTCVIVHTGLYHGKALFNGLRKVRVEADDIHAKLMRNYPEVPDWWYLTSFAVFFGLAVVAVEVWHTEVPVWALLLSVMLPIIYVLPSGFIYAMTGQGITINILAQIIPGTLLPGKPLVNMLFKAYSVQTLAAATSFVQDLKLGHYVKVPPRATFIVQMVSTVLAAFIQVGVKEWMFTNVKDICNQNQKSQLTCPHNQVFFTASAVWGLIGPTRQFGTGSLYHPHLYAIIVGAFLPLPFYLWQRKYPNSWARYVSTPVILNGVSSIPPATGINYSSWFAVGFAFQYLIRKRNFAWWSKFNYVLSSALDSGTVIAVITIFFTLQFPRGGSISVNWWGNQVFQGTADYNRSAFLPIPAGGITWTGFPPVATNTAALPLVTTP